MRPQDLWPLRPMDVLRERGGIQLSRFASRDETGKLYIKERGKSNRSRRFVPLLDGVLDILEAYAATRSIAAGDLLFADANGNMRRDYNFRQRIWKPLVKSIGRPDAKIKTLRHSANSFMANLGVSADIRAAILGNSPAVNTWIYTHVSDAAKREAISRIAPLFATLLSTEFHAIPQPVGDKRGKGGADDRIAVA